MSRLRPGRGDLVRNDVVLTMTFILTLRHGDHHARSINVQSHGTDLLLLLWTGSELLASLPVLTQYCPAR